MNKNLIIFILVFVFSFLFVHSELTIADCEEHMHEQHDFCVLVQNTVPVKQIVNSITSIQTLEIEPLFEFADQNESLFFSYQFNYPKNKTISKPLYIVKQSLLI